MFALFLYLNAFGFKYLVKIDRIFFCVFTYLYSYYFYQIEIIMYCASYSVYRYQKYYFFKTFQSIKKYTFVWAQYLF